MRKTVVACDHIAMRFGAFQATGVAEFPAWRSRVRLVGDVLGMLERQLEKDPHLGDIVRCYSRSLGQAAVDLSFLRRRSRRVFLFSAGGSMIHFEGFAAVLAILAVSVVPVMLAARFVGAGRAGVVFSAIAVVLGGVAAYVTFTAFGGSLTGIFLAFIAMCIAYALVLRASIPKAFGLTIMALSLQVMIAFAVVSFGVRFYQIDPLPAIHASVDRHP